MNALSASVLAVLAGLPAAAAPDFARDLYPHLETALCRTCHSDNGVGSTTRLQFPPESAAPADVAAFGFRLRALVDPASPSRSLLYVKPTARVAHGGGERIKRGSDAEKALLAWVERLAALPDAALPAAKGEVGPSRPSLLRLTHSQYNHTVRDLLGDETNPAGSFPKEDFVHGFTNQAEAQAVSPLLAEAYGKAAERIARNASRAGKLDWAEDAIPAFGFRVFRRPLDSAELERYRKLFRAGGAQLVAEAMLQSPNFLFHLEPGPYALASRLSYFLWDTTPDPELLRAAASGRLHRAEDVEKQVARLLDHPRARDAFDVFFSQWMRFDRLRGAIRDRRRFPEFTTELVNAMIEESTRFFRALLWEDRDFREFFTARWTFLGPDLARIYDLPPPAEPWARVEFPDASPRAGILGQPLFLAITSKPVDTSPTERGIFVREHFLCQQVPPPPPGINATLPAVTDEKPVSTRDRLSQHLANPVCAGCHSLVDPIGFGLEGFDAIGKHRSTEKIVIYPTFDETKTRRKTKPTEYDLPIDAHGFLRGIAGAEFTTPVELGRILAAEPACQRCIVKQLFRWAAGRAETPEDAPVIEAATRRFRRSHFRFRELIIAIATSETFR
ncbi:MAG: DUF1592 domain-containing protein [Bryobacteraceae bacterium]